MNQFLNLEENNSTSDRKIQIQNYTNNMGDNDMGVLVETQITSRQVYLANFVPWNYGRFLCNPPDSHKKV